MQKKRPITTVWYVKLIIIIFVAAAIYLTVKSFVAGYNEGREIRKVNHSEQKALSK